MSRVETISCGEELLDGRVADANGSFMAARLAAHGRAVARHTVVGDDAGEIAACLREALGRAPDVVLTGGLGPTDDDRTREAAAEAAESPLELREELMDAIARRLGRSVSDLGERNRRQALLPRLARAIENPHGTAPGFRIEKEGRRLWCLPGVPAEMRPMFERDVLPALTAEAAAPGAPRPVRLHAVGLPESECDRLAAGALAGFKGVEHGITVRFGVITVALRSKNAAARLKEAAAAVREALGTHLFGEGECTLASAVVDLLAARGLTLALAESCTGGLAAARVVDVAGASRVLLEAVVAYANEAKTRRLGVPAGLLGRHGAASEEAARAMAEGARRESGAGLAAAATGVAGPGGGTPERPVGRVCLAVASARGTRAQTRDFRGDRETVRERAVTSLLDLVRREALALSEGKP